MYCKQCGKELESQDAMFCSFCGAKQFDTEEDVQEQPQPYDMHVEEEQTQQSYSPPPHTPYASPWQTNKDSSFENMPPKPQTWLGQNIFALICCCLPIAIAGIVYASKVDNAYYSRDYAAAQRYSNQARTFFILSVVLGAIFSMIWLAIKVSS